MKSQAAVVAACFGMGADGANIAATEPFMLR